MCITYISHIENKIFTNNGVLYWWDGHVQPYNDVIKGYNPSFTLKKSDLAN